MAAARYFDLVREMRDAYNHRLRLVESARQHGRKPTVRLFATTVPTVRKWFRRFQLLGPSGLQELSRAPHRQTLKTLATREAPLIELRKTLPTFGARRLGLDVGQVLLALIFFFRFFSRPCSRQMRSRAPWLRGRPIDPETNSCRDFLLRREKGETAPPARGQAIQRRSVRFDPAQLGLVEAEPRGGQGSRSCSLRYINALISYGASSMLWPCVIASVGQASTQYPQKMQRE